MTDQKVWKYSGDSREDRAKRVAESYRALALRIAHENVENPGYEVYRLDQAWMDNGCNWIVPTHAPLDLEGWLSAKDLAHMIGRAQRDIYDWHRRGHLEQRIEADGSPVYSVASAVAYNKQARLRRGAA